MLRLTFLLRKRPNLSHDEFYQYWLEEHGPLVASHARRLGMLRYLQVHRVRDEALDGAFTRARGTEVEAYDGHAELWFERTALMGSTPEQVAAGRRAVADEAHFIDFKRSTMWLAKEHVFVDHR